jgi:hypothetical protein
MISSSCAMTTRLIGRVSVGFDVPTRCDLTDGQEESIFGDDSYASSQSVMNCGPVR